MGANVVVGFLAAFASTRLKPGRVVDLWDAGIDIGHQVDLRGGNIVGGCSGMGSRGQRETSFVQIGRPLAC